MTKGVCPWVLSFSLLVCGPSQARADVSLAPCDGTPTCVEDLRNVTDALDGKVIGEAAAAKARQMDTSHDEALAQEGRDYGLYFGNQITENSQWPEATGQDCTTFVLEVLKEAFTAAGAPEEWNRILNEAVKNSGGKFKGLELLKSLQKTGWTGIYWNPDTKHPVDDDSEHPYSAYVAQKKGTYYGLTIDPERSVLNYRPTEYLEDGQVETPIDSSGIDSLKDIPFGVVAARGGRHMALIINGEVYEVHWSTPATSQNVISNEPLSEWAWLSGVVLVPPGY